MRRYLIRFIKLFLGLFLFSIGTVITIKANIGLAPWDAFHMGISIQTGNLFRKSCYFDRCYFADCFGRDERKIRIRYRRQCTFYRHIL